ncbi:MAG: carboxymuconolactone decarboxylase family protein [Bryobacterales bacterium]|nr:carboxymuconolactone decarboxylase family protein [Bryobacterales bacterium]
MRQPLPESILKFQKHHPRVWEAFSRFADECHEAGPLDEKTRRLVKLALAIGHRHEGAVHSAVRQALAAGLTQEELFHAAILAISTIGWPASYAAITWIGDAIEGPAGQPPPSD